MNCLILYLFFNSFIELSTRLRLTKRLKKQRASVLFKAVEDHQLHTRASKRALRSSGDEDFEDGTSFKAVDIELLKQPYTRRPGVEGIGPFLALFRVKKAEIEEISRSQIPPF